MSRKFSRAIALLVAVSLSGCKFVKTDASGAASNDAGGDAKVIVKTLDSRLLPLIAEKSLPIAELRAAVASNLDTAGQEYGHRGAGQGAAWNFPVKGEGTVVSANLESRARTADLDSDGDGKVDMTLQFGPVIKGTALRDVAPFYDFGDFRDQIEFAELARAINDAVSGNLKISEADLTGKKLSFTGVVALKSATDPWFVTAATIEVLP